MSGHGKRAAPLRIAIASAGRFHVLDLARELHRLGHEVRFYSHVPRRRTRRFGLPGDCHVSLLPCALPALLWQRLAPGLLPLLRERLLDAALNYTTIGRLRHCDVFICMSGIYLEAARYAKRRYGAAIWLHRGSRHILSQDEILATIPNAERPSAWVIARELAGYALADRIIVQARHVEESFRRDPDACSKLFRNPTGTDTVRFSVVPPRRVCEPFSILFVGTWSLRKGCDVLAGAVRRLDGVRLTHVGSIGDLAFPASDFRFRHVDAMPQWRLPAVYRDADLFVLASREEGLSQVLVQALAGGLPIVCTDRSGGLDLRHTPALTRRITVVPHSNPDALAEAIADWRDRLRAGAALPPLAEADRETLSWAAYARRYDDELRRVGVGKCPALDCRRETIVA